MLINKSVVNADVVNGSGSTPFTTYMTITAGVGNILTFRKGMAKLASVAQASAASLLSIDAYLRALTAAQASAASAVRRIGRAFLATQASSATITKIEAAVRSLVASTLLSSSLAFVRGKLITVAKASVATLIGQRSRLMTVAQATVPTLAKVRLSFLTATKATAVVMVRGVSYTRTATLIAGAILAKIFQKLMVSTAQGSTAAMTRGSAVLKNLAVGFVMQTALIRSLARRFSASSSTSSSIKGVMGKLMVYQATVGAFVVRRIGKITPLIVSMVPTVQNAMIRILNAGSVTVSKMVRGIGFTLAPPIMASIEVVLKSVGKPILASSVTLASVWKGSGKALAASSALTATLAAARRMLRTCAASTAQTALVARSIWKALATAVTASASVLTVDAYKIVMWPVLTVTSFIRFSFPRVLSSALTLAPKLLRGLKSALVSYASSVSLVIRGGIPQRLTSASTVGVLLSRGRGKALAAAQASSALMLRGVGKFLAASYSVATWMNRQIRDTLAATVTLNKQISLSFNRAIVASISLAALLIKGRLVVKLLSLASTLSPSLLFPALKQRSLSALSTLTATLSELERIYRVLSASVSSSALLRNSLPKVLQAAQASVASLLEVERFSRLLSAAQASVASTQRSILDTLSVISSTTSKIAKSAGKLMASVLTASPVLSKGWAKVLSSVVHPASSVVFNLMGTINRKFYMIGATMRRYLRG